jgi:ABC-type uncharacterized transport system involved in gliding motility auxiliary subunit
MEHVKKYLGPAAAVLILMTLAAVYVWPYKKALIVTLAAAAFLALAGTVALNLGRLSNRLHRRSLMYSGNAILTIVVVLAILVLANYFLAKHSYRMDFTAARIHSLSDQSITVLKALKTDVAVKAFFRPGTQSREAMDDLLKLYAYHSPRIKFEFVDPDKNPEQVKSYDITQDGTTIIDVGGRETRITATGEEDVTNALIKATRGQKKVIYFLEGHGEQTLEESGDSGYSTLKTELEKLGYDVKEQTLALADTFPKDCALLVVPGPQKDLLPNELQTLKSYIQSGGRILFMVDPQTTVPGLVLFLAGYGFKLEDDIIVDRVSRLLGGDYFMPVVSEYESHDITRRFNYATFFPVARSVEISETKPEGETLTALAKTSENSYAKIDFVAKPKMTLKDIAFAAGKDRQGPLTLAAVATLKVKTEAPPAAAPKPGENPPAGPAGQEKEARIAVVGDSDFVKNQYYGLSGNGNFFLNVANWLTEESDLISIQPKTQTPRTIQLTPTQMSLINLIVFYLLPLGTLAAGIAIWLRRRAL